MAGLDGKKILFESWVTPLVKQQQILTQLYHTVPKLWLEQVQWKLHSILQLSLISLRRFTTYDVSTKPHHFTHTRRTHSCCRHIFGMNQIPYDFDSFLPKLGGSVIPFSVDTTIPSFWSSCLLPPFVHNTMDDLLLLETDTNTTTTEDDCCLTTWNVNGIHIYWYRCVLTTTIITATTIWR